MSGRKAQDGEQLHAAREPLSLLSRNLPKTNLHVNLVFHGPFLHREAGERSNLLIFRPLLPSSCPREKCLAILSLGQVYIPKPPLALKRVI